MDLPYLDAQQLAAALPWPVAIDALRDAVGPAFASGRFIDRSSVPAAGGELLLMPASSPRAVGVKVVGIGADNARLGLPRIHGVYVLFDARTLAPRAILDGTALTTIRTAAQSAMVADRLAAAQASRLVVFGTGPQARAHIEALCAVRPLSSIGVVGRRPDAVERLVADLAGRDVAVQATTANRLGDADIVVCATTSTEPLFDGRQLADRALVIAVGSHTPQARELDDHTVTRARVVLVEDRDTALREAGDVIIPLASGALDAQRLLDLRGLDSLRPGGPGVIVYKSVGMAYQDLAVAEAAVESARLSTDPTPEEPSRCD